MPRIPEIFLRGVEVILEVAVLVPVGVVVAVLGVAEGVEPEARAAEHAGEELVGVDAVSDGLAQVDVAARRGLAAIEHHHVSRVRLFLNDGVAVGILAALGEGGEVHRRDGVRHVELAGLQTGRDLGDVRHELEVDDVNVGAVEVHGLRRVLPVLAAALERQARAGDVLNELIWRGADCLHRHVVAAVLISLPGDDVGLNPHVAEIAVVRRGLKGPADDVFVHLLQLLDDAEASGVEAHVDVGLIAEHNVGGGNVVAGGLHKVLVNGAERADAAEVVADPRGEGAGLARDGDVHRRAAIVGFPAGRVRFAAAAGEEREAKCKSKAECKNTFRFHFDLLFFRVDFYERGRRGSAARIIPVRGASGRLHIPAPCAILLCVRRGFYPL